MGDHAATRSAAEPAFLTTAEASQAIGITPFTLEQYRTLRKRGVVRGPDFVRFGRTVLYPREAIAAFVTARDGAR